MRPALTALPTLVLGAVVGLASVAVHPLWWGLLLALAATLATLVALPRGAARLGFALGWVGLLAWLMFPRSEGDYVISADFNGYLLLGAGAAVLMSAVATLPRRTGHISGEDLTGSGTPPSMSR